MFAIQNSHLNIIDFLINKKSNVNAQNKEKQTPMSYYFKKSKENIIYDFSVLEFLVKNKCDLNIEGDSPTPLLFFATKGIKYIKFLVENGAKINLQNRKKSTALHLCCEFTNHLDSIQFLVENKADINLPDVNNFTPLYSNIFFKNTNFETLNFLVENGAKILVTSFDVSSLRFYNDESLLPRVIDLLIKSYSLTPEVLQLLNLSLFNVASRSLDLDVISSLLNLKANINFTDKILDSNQSLFIFIFFYFFLLFFF